MEFFEDALFLCFHVIGMIEAFQVKEAVHIQKREALLERDAAAL